MSAPRTAGGRAPADRRSSASGSPGRDEYAWLRDPAYPEVGDPEIRAYLEAENAYFEAVMAPHRGWSSGCTPSSRRGIKADDSSVPVREGGVRVPLALLRRARSTGPGSGGRWRRPSPTLILDENELAAGKSYFSLRALERQPGRPAPRLHHRRGRLGAVPAAPAGPRRPARSWPTSSPTPRVRSSGPRTGATLLYVELNEQLRPFRVRAHRLGERSGRRRRPLRGGRPGLLRLDRQDAQPALRSLIATGTHVTREIRLLDAADPAGAAAAGGGAARGASLQPRPRARPASGSCTNDRHENFRLVSAPEPAPEERHWREEIAGDDRHYLPGGQLLSPTSWCSPSARTGSPTCASAPMAAASTSIAVRRAGLHGRRSATTASSRPTASGSATPRWSPRASVIDYVVDDARADRPQGAGDPLGLRPGALRHAPADGAGRGRGRGADHHRPPRRLPARGRRAAAALRLRRLRPRARPGLRASRLSLLDRGIAFAYAHVRGGDEMGYRWYREGKLDTKAQQLHRLHRLRRVPDPRGLHARRPDRDQGRQRRRAC